MANCKRCDRCGSFYEESNNIKKNIPHFRSVNKINFGTIDIQSVSGNWVGPFDLCPTCGEEFYNWLANKKENTDGEQGTEKTKKET